MAAKIIGTVFDDINNNTIYDSSDPGIPSTILTLYNGTTCQTTTTDSNGNYSFNISDPGKYTVFETCNPPNACPPTRCDQPEGFTCSNTKRKGSVTVTSSQITGSTTIPGPNFGHSKDTYIPCSSFGLQISGGTLYKLNMITGTPTEAGTPGSGNALAYEANSQKLFYIRGNNVLRINGDMTTTDLGPYFGSIIATCDTLGRMLMPSGSNISWKMMDQASPDFLEQGIITVQGTIQTQFDWTYNPVDNLLHTTLQTINLDTGVITPSTYKPLIPGGIGAAFSDKDGFDYWLQNSSGDITRSRLTSQTTGTSLLFSKTVPASSNDGASCIYASLSPDFGDCPDNGELPLSKDNYRSLLSKNGPRHATINPIYFGNGFSQEPDALQNPTATGDTLDDGVILPLPKLRVNSKNYTVDITVVNAFNINAHVYAWIDYDNNGVFSGDESAEALLIPPNTSTIPRSFKLTFSIPSNKVLSKGNTFLRMRITSVTLVNRNSNNLEIEDTRSYGVAEDGEVEDHLLEIGSNPQAQLEKFVDKSQAQLGEIIKYTFVITNIGDIDITSPTIVDTLPQNSLFTSSSSGGTISNIGGSTIFTISPNISLAPLESYTITFFVKGISLIPTDVLQNNGLLSFKSAETSDPTLYYTYSNYVETILLPLNPLEITKYVDKKYADLGETIHYTISIRNPNLVPSINNIFKDTIPYFTTFIPNSFTDDGVTIPGNPEFGVPISDMPPLALKTVTFNVLIN